MFLSRKLTAVALSVALSLCVSTAPLPAQQESASITGQITDSSGATIAGARVTIRNQASGALFNSVSDADGFYRAPQLRPGMYAISVTASGFSTAVREGIEARVNDRLRVDMPMQIAAESAVAQQLKSIEQRRAAWQARRATSRAKTSAPPPPAAEADPLQAALVALELARQLVDFVVIGGQQDQGVMRIEARLVGVALGMRGLPARNCHLCLR